MKSIETMKKQPPKTKNLPLWKCQTYETYPNGKLIESCDKCCYYQDKKCVFGDITKENNGGNRQHD
jgi:hypothetical protein